MSTGGKKKERETMALSRLRKGEMEVHSFRKEE